MKKVDFLFVYEVKARELENICLLKYELERRGYTVVLINTWYYLKRKVPRYKANVVVTFALYNNDTYKFITSYVKKINKLVNLQWEQVGTTSDEKSEKSLFYIKGEAKKAVHVCWGMKTKERLMQNCGIDEKKLMLTGHISLDFLRDDLVSYYQSKEEIFKEFSIPANKKICLFISSFSHVNLPDDIIGTDTDIGYSLMEYIKLSNKSQEKIIEWITLVLLKHRDIIFIYRPHPAEANNEKLVDLAHMYDNLFVISELSIKQWILVSDVMYTWYSTSLAEIYASGKRCFILRPLPIPQDIDLAIYEGAEFVTDFSSFESTLDNNEQSFPVQETVMTQYYYIDRNTPAYSKICDGLIDIYNNDYFLIPESGEGQKLSIKKRFKNRIYRSFINDYISYISENTRINIPILNRRRQSKLNGYSAYIDDMTSRNYASENEINQIVGRIKTVLK